MTRRPFVWCTVAFSGLVLCARVGAAQEVTGIVRGEPGRTPLAGAVVILTSQSGARLTGTLTDDAGRFRFRPPAAGTYALRIDVVGYRTETVAPFTVDSGATVSRDILFRFERTALPAVAITATTSCSRISTAGDAGEATRLWAEARKALEAARLAIDEQRFSATFQRYERMISLPDSVVRASRTWTQTGVTRDPFESLPADTVARTGFSVQRDSARYYYAPDAAVLLSDVFVAGHCFGTRPGGSDGSVGLTFRPQRVTDRVDIDGVLWLDTTAALRSLEYRYVPAAGRADVGGGFVAFGPYPSGVWGVRRWAIRLPVLQIHESRRRPDGALGRFVDTVVTAFREEGGEVMTGPVARGPTTSLTGTVFDSTLGKPLPAAVVTVEGLARTARTDSAGRFVIDTLTDGGEVRLRAWHPRLDSLGLAPPTVLTRIRRGAENTVQLSVAGVSAVARARCRRVAWETPRVITGVALRAADPMTPAPAVEVALLERRSGLAGARDSLVRHTEVTNDAGRFAFCAAQRGTEAWVLARSGVEWSVPRFVAGDDRAAAVTIIPLRLPADVDAVRPDSVAVTNASSTTVLGRVMDPGIPSRIAGWVLRAEDAPGEVQALVDDIVRTTAAPDGSFRLDSLTTGRHLLLFRAQAQVAVRVPVTVQAGQSQLLLVTLRPAPAVVVQRRVMAPDSWVAGFRQRQRAGNGVFFDRAAIEARNAQTLADLLRTVQGVRVQIGNGGNRYVSTHFRRLGPPSAGDDGGSCDMMLYVDGQAFPVESGGADLRIRVTEVEAMEVYVTAASVPRQFAGSSAACGVIVIWRR